MSAVEQKRPKDMTQEELEALPVGRFRVFCPFLGDGVRGDDIALWRSKDGTWYKFVETPTGWEKEKVSI